MTETVNEVIARLAVFTDEQRSLAFCPMPPKESAGGSDCRPGGSCGLDFSFESFRSRVRQAKFRFRREQERAA